MLALPLLDCFRVAPASTLQGLLRHPSRLGRQFARLDSELLLNQLRHDCPCPHAGIQSAWRGTDRGNRTISTIEIPEASHAMHLKAHAGISRFAAIPDHPQCRAQSSCSAYMLALEEVDDAHEFQS